MKARYEDIRELLNEYPYASGCLDEIDIDGLRTGATLVFTDEDIDEGKTEVLFKIQDFGIKRLGRINYIVVNGYWCYYKLTKLDKLNGLKTCEIKKGWNFLEGTARYAYSFEAKVFDNEALYVDEIEKDDNDNDNDFIENMFNELMKP